MRKNAIQNNIYADKIKLCWILNLWTDQSTKKSGPQIMIMGIIIYNVFQGFQFFHLYIIFLSSEKLK
jgi:hypothetical protein